MAEREQIIAISGLMLVLVGVIAASVTTEIEATGYFVSEGENIGDLKLELAETPEERRTGLMNRTRLGSDRGMLFIFSDESRRAFWMKNTYIPLDLVYIDSDNTVVDIKKAYPEEDKPDAQLRRYIGGPAKYVLEVNQNYTDRKGIEVGDRFYFNRSR